MISSNNAACLERCTRDGKFLLSVAILALAASTGIAGQAFAFSYNTNYPATETDSTGHASLKDPSTGISVTITNSNSNVSFGFMDQKITAPTNGEGGPDIDNVQYYGISLLGISSGSARICIPDSSATASTTIQFWNMNKWSTLSDVSSDGSQICGSASVYSFIGDDFTYLYTDVAIGEPAHR